MAFGLGNTGAITYAVGFAALSGNMARQIGGPGWTAASGDVTPIGAQDGFLRTKIISGRHNQEPIDVEFFMDPNTIGAPPSATVNNTLVITYPTGLTTFSMPAGMTAFKLADLIDDEVMVGSCQFLVIGGVAMDGTQA